MGAGDNESFLFGVFHLRAASWICGVIGLALSVGGLARVSHGIDKGFSAPAAPIFVMELVLMIVWTITTLMLFGALFSNKSYLILPFIVLCMCAAVFNVYWLINLVSIGDKLTVFAGFYYIGTIPLDLYLFYTMVRVYRSGLIN